MLPATVEMDTQVVVAVAVVMVVLVVQLLVGKVLQVAQGKMSTHNIRVEVAEELAEQVQQPVPATEELAAQEHQIQLLEQRLHMQVAVAVVVAADLVAVEALGAVERGLAAHLEQLVRPILEAVAGQWAALARE